jgi:hypothetical protein
MDLSRLPELKEERYHKETNAWPGRSTNGAAGRQQRAPHTCPRRRPLPSSVRAVPLKLARDLAGQFGPWLAPAAPCASWPAACAPGLPVNLVSLGPVATVRDRNLGGIEDMALNPFSLKHALDPEPIKTRLRNSDDRKHLAGSSALSLATAQTALAGWPHHHRARCAWRSFSQRGSREAISYVNQPSLIELTIAPGPVRIAVCSNRGSTHTGWSPA